MNLRDALAAAALAAFASAANATSTFSSDLTDLWWNQDESGWGINLIQQSNVLFATLFVYDTTGYAHWYVASDMEGDAVPTDRPYVFTGRLYETTGPAFSASSFNPAAVTRRDVGAIRLEFIPPATGTLTYAVDGVTVTKSITRQTWRSNNLAGTFAGAEILQKSPFSAASCSPKTGFQAFESIVITHADTTISIVASWSSPPAEQCRYTGTYSQAGHMGVVDGVYSCDSGANGTFQLREMELGTNGFTANLFATDRGCGVYGNIAGIRRN